jgi:hypothetical protein
MLFGEFEERQRSSEQIVFDESIEVSASFDGLCLVNGLYALPLEAVSALLPRCESISVLDENGSAMADLITCRGEEFTPTQYSAAYLSAYLAEIDATRFGFPGNFARDYLIIDEGRVNDYNSSKLHSSPIWGGFLHATPPVPLLLTKDSDPIMAIGGIASLSQIELETAQRSILQPFAFERYLKLYHLLELRFDQDIVRKIQELGDDIKGISKILSKYDRTEVVKLKEVIEQCRNPRAVVDCLSAISADPRWHPYIRSMFFEYGTGGNPILLKEDEFMWTLGNSGFSFESMRTVAGISKNLKAQQQQRAFEKFCLSLSTYWIYKVRCSIAHSKIGEYILRAEDEPFVAFFAERLLRCVLSHVL